MESKTRVNFCVAAAMMSNRRYSRFAQNDQLIVWYFHHLPPPTSIGVEMFQDIFSLIQQQ